MLGAVFPEGPCHSRGTFRARGCFSGRSVPLQGDLPGQGLFLWQAIWLRSYPVQKSDRVYLHVTPNYRIL